MSYPTTSAHEVHKQQKKQRSRQVVAEGNEIGLIPPVADPDRRERCRLSLQEHAITYFSKVVGDDPDRWAPYHFELIKRLEAAAFDDQWAAFAMPRGGGKSTWCEIATNWASSHGHRRFVVMVGATAAKAQDRLRSVQVEFTVNDLLLADFPEICYPIEKLQRISMRAKTQTCGGVPTGMIWSTGKLVLPHIEGSASSGSVIQAAGLTGGDLRGSVHKTDEGELVRPDMVICDDPQTDESARSYSQTETRERLISGSVGYLGGPGKQVSVIMPCTVIARDDLADRMTDTELHPEWHGLRFKTLESYPTDTALWEQYEEILRADFQAGGTGTRATDFYAENREAMDEGAVVTWEHRYNPKREISAVQAAMNLKIRDPIAFAAEGQNDPEEASNGDNILVGVEDICKKQSGLKRGVVPLEAERVVAFVDVQASILYYCVYACDKNFTGSVIDYGTYPKQKRSYFRLGDVKATLADVYGKEFGGEDAQIFAGVTDLTNELCETVWTREDGVELRVEKLLVDTGAWLETINHAIRKSKYGAIVMPSRGIGIGAANVPMDEMPCPRGKGIKRGFHWRTRPTNDRDKLRYVQIDANFWKTAVHKCFRFGLGANGCLTLFDAPRQNHRMIAEHCNGENPVHTMGRGRDLFEWKERPGKPDNHLFDCLAGCLCAASVQGCVFLDGQEATYRAPPRKRYKL